MHIHNLLELCTFVQTLLSINEILTSIIIKGHNSVLNVQKRTDNNCNLDLAIVNAYTKFGQIMSILS